MPTNEPRLASAGTEGRGAINAPAEKPGKNSRIRKAKPTLRVRKLPDGEPFTVAGRLAQTLGLLVEVGATGFTSGEASPLGWARRTSDYVHRLRGLGLVISSGLEPVGDARVSRYRLESAVEVVEAREGAQ